MSDGFAPEWLAARDPYDVAALDGAAISMLRAWAAQQPTDRPLRVVDLGCGTGAGLRRALGWLGGRAVHAYAVDGDPALLARLDVGDSGAGLATVGDAAGSNRPQGQGVVLPVLADLLGPLDESGGPADGTVDLVVSHAVADLLPLDRFAMRVAALLRPGGYAHLALTYDGETAFAPTDDPRLDRRVTDAYHRHMDLARAGRFSHGGSTAGRRLFEEVTAAGLDVVQAAPSIWNVRASDGPAGRAVLDSLVGFIVRSVSELGEPPPAELACWERARRAALNAGELGVRVRHVDILARRPAWADSGARPIEA